MTDNKVHYNTHTQTDRQTGRDFLEIHRLLTVYSSNVSRYGAGYQENQGVKGGWAGLHPVPCEFPVLESPNGQYTSHHVSYNNTLYK